MTKLKIGDIVTMRSWTDEWIEVRIKKFGESKEYGPSVEGMQMDGNVVWRNVALPLSHLIETATATNVSHGKWDVTIPGGEVIRVKSKKAVQELCIERGFVFQEGDL